VVELQARAIPHYHTLIRLDATPTEWGEPVAAPVTSITATELAALAQIAAGQVRLTVADADGGSRALRFGEQIDTQPLTADLTIAATDTTDAASAAARRVAGIWRSMCRVNRAVTQTATGGAPPVGAATWSRCERPSL
jgi:hypothetical protein